MEMTDLLNILDDIDNTGGIHIDEFPLLALSENDDA